MENKKNNSFCMILYKDSTSYNYNEIINYIEKNIERYAYIEHKKENEDLKDHTHVVMYFKNRRYAHAIAKNDFKSNEIDLKLKPCNLIPMLRYLIHYDDEDKIQYSIEQVKGPLKEKLKNVINGKNTDKDNLNDIIDFILNCSCTITFKSVFVYCLNMNYFSSYLRYYAIIRDIIQEHNNLYLQ